MSSNAKKNTAVKTNPSRWIVRIGLPLLIIFGGYSAFHSLHWWASASTPPDRELAQTSKAGETPEEHHKYTNHLIHETSPYLLQHAHNPVNWYSWGSEALAKAKKEDKPIFVSIGYSTCYWCHVMEVESFETEEVAKILNEHFIAIKVDREERPDIDEQYMLATQLVTGRGGWPNSVWLTPDGRPWMAGTYYPKVQFIRILKTLSGHWKDRRKDVEKQADQLAQAIRRAGGSQRFLQSGSTVGPVDQKLIDNAITKYKRAFDKNRGGFSLSPKFPPHGILRVIIHEYRRTGDEALLQMITSTLDGMWLGGMHDHVGGGFHRYSTDRFWLLPHFEKMLYDNAQLMRAYTDGYLVSGFPRYREAVEDIFRWVQSEMTSPEGGFYSAIDSGEVGKEGETYVWHYKEIVELLGEKDATLFAEVYNIGKLGNFSEESTGKQPGTNIIHLKKPLTEIASARGESPESLKARLAALRAKLLTRRNTWVQPHKDDKILTSWNGLMIGSLAYAGRELNEPKYTKAAVKAADFILNHLVDDQKRLLRTYRIGQAKLPGYLDDNAYMAEALLDLYVTTGEKRWLDEAKRLGDVMLAEFEDKKNGAFFFTAASHEDLLMRSKSLMGGGNVPSANGVAVLALFEISRLTGSKVHAQAAKRAIEALFGILLQSPRGLGSAIYAVAVALEHNVTEPLQDVDASSADVSKRLGPVTARLFSSRLSVKSGDTMYLALALEVDEGWHLYGPNPDADFLVPTSVSVSSKGAISVGNVSAPEPRKKLDSILKQVLSTYEGRIWYFVPITVSKDSVDGKVKLTMQIKTQACDQNRCLPPRTDEIELTFNVTSKGIQSSLRHPGVFKNIPSPIRK